MWAMDLWKTDMVLVLVSHIGGASLSRRALLSGRIFIFLGGS